MTFKKKDDPILIDARNEEVQDLLKKLKEVLASTHGADMEINIFVKNASDAKQVKGFVTMSGGKTKIDKKDTFYIIHVKGNVCCA